MPEITAIRYHDYGPVDVLSADRIEAPRPAPGEVLVDVRAVSVNPVDWKIRAGFLKDVFKLAFPATPGRDGSGVVTAVGERVDAALVGRRVCFMTDRNTGTWAETIAFPAELAVPIPDTLSFVEAAALPLAGLSAWIPLVIAAPVEAGMRVLIHAAAGGAGSIAVQIAHMRGATVAATCSRRNVDFVKSLGADEVIAYDEAAFEDRLQDLDLVFDLVGGGVHEKSCRVLRKGGTLVCLNATPFEDRSADYGVRLVRPVIEADPAVLGELVRLAGEGRITPVVERVCPFSEFKAAQLHNESGHARGKIVVEIAP